MSSRWKALNTAKASPSKTIKRRAQETVPANALLIYAGAVPRTDWLAGVVERDAQGYLISGQHLMREGRRPGGMDCRSRSVLS